jgi:transcriptional regulator with XRE-family HTH domain
MLLEAMIVMHIGELIQQKRIEKGIGQTELAQRAYVGVLYIKHIEKGIGGLSFDKIVRIAYALDLDISELASFYIE